MHVFSGIGLAVCIASGIAAQASPDTALDGLYALIQRRIPAHNQSFNLILTPNDSTVLDTFTLSDADSQGQGNSQINIQCTSVSACARGLYT